MTATEPFAPKTTGIVVLAAGSSSRLGQPKQLLEYKGESLLRHSVQAALETALRPVIVVLGSGAVRVRNDVEELPVQVIDNPEWQEGMASSIRCGVKMLMTVNPFAEGLILMVCDQPFVSKTLLDELIATHQNSRKPIVACSYGGSFGPPVFFHSSLFSELLALQGDVGARGVIRRYANEVALVPFDKGSFDVDTNTDYENLKNHEDRN